MQPKESTPPNVNPRPAAISGDGPSVLQPVVSLPAAPTARTRPKGSAPVPAVTMSRSRNIRQITHGNMTWVDIVHPGEAEIEWLRQNYNFHPLHLDDTLSKIQRSKIDDRDDYTFMVMHFPVYSKLVRVTTASEVDIFVGANYVITAHTGGLTPLTRLFSQCVEDPAFREAARSRSTHYRLYQRIDRLIDYCIPSRNKIDLNSKQGEDEIFEEKVRHTIQKISLIRRDIISFRRVIKPLIPVISSLERKHRSVFGEDMEEYFGDLADHLSKIWDTLEDFKEVIEGLSDTSNSLTSSRINEIIKVLTLISVILLPLTLISGIFGMNIDLPADDHPYAFEIVAGIMFLVILAMLAVFRWRRWI